MASKAIVPVKGVKEQLDSDGDDVNMDAADRVAARMSQASQNLGHVRICDDCAFQDGRKQCRAERNGVGCSDHCERCFPEDEESDGE